MNTLSNLFGHRILRAPATEGGEDAGPAAKKERPVFSDGDIAVWAPKTKTNKGTGETWDEYPVSIGAQDAKKDYFEVKARTPGGDTVLTPEQVGALFTEDQIVIKLPKKNPKEGDKNPFKYLAVGLQRLADKVVGDKTYHNVKLVTAYAQVRKGEDPDTAPIIGFSFYRPKPEGANKPEDPLAPRLMVWRNQGQKNGQQITLSLVEAYTVGIEGATVERDGVRVKMTGEEGNTAKTAIEEINAAPARRSAVLQQAPAAGRKR